MPRPEVGPIVVIVDDAAGRQPALRRLSLEDLWLPLPLLVIGIFGTRPAGDDQELSRYADPLAFVLVVVAVLSLVLRRVRPEATLAICGVAIAIYLGLGYPYGPILLTAPLAVYAVASRTPLRRAAAYASMFYAVTLLTATLRYLAADQQLPVLSWVFSWAAVVFGSVATGVAVRMRRESEAELRAAAASRAVSEERLRMAEELHDSVGHGLAVIAMQAGVALHVLERDPAKAREALEAIRATSRASLDDLRVELDALRTPQGEVVPRQPAPGLADIDVLIERIRAGGVEVDARIDSVGTIPPEVDAAAYRILQESLTNVLRHSAGSTARVCVNRASDAIVVEVADNGPTRSDSGLSCSRRSSWTSTCSRRCAAGPAASSSKMPRRPNCCTPSEWSLPARRCCPRRLPGG
jgi:signal transduction histidine kinase